MKKVLIFGSTGSVGKSALEVIRRDRKNFKVLGLCAKSDIKTLYSQIKEFRPSYVCVRDEKQAGKLGQLLGKGIKLFKGEKGLEEFAALESDISLMAISGIFCLKPLLINMKHTKRIALANKESLVAAGKLVFKAARQFKVEIFSVDSEINAFFQLIKMRRRSRVHDSYRKVYLTASGGALAGYKREDMARVGVKEVLAHPTWKMGKRITVDSATLVNKGFEAVETHLFFGLPYEKIDILIHKESNVHALVEYKDNALFACVYPPDMKIPISFTFYYPKRLDFGCSVNFKNSFSYSFAPVCYKKYPLLDIILRAAKRADNSLAILGACDEIAVDYFLKKKINFTDIYKVMEHIYSDYPSQKIKNIEDVFFWDNWGRMKAKEYLKKL